MLRSLRGFQTIIYGRFLEDISSALKTIKTAGFNAVELFQHPSNLVSRQVKGFDDLIAELRKHDLELMGLAGGSLAERVAYCQKATRCDRTGFYLYVDDLDDPAVESALDAGYRLAVHPHAFTRYQGFESVLSHRHYKHSNVFLLPDVAHIFICGFDPVRWLKTLDSAKIIAVHLKDWDQAYGRARNTYAKGFTELGYGDVPLEAVLEVMAERGIGNWVLEQDYARKSVNDSISKNTVWLAKHNLIDRPVEAHELPPRPPRTFSVPRNPSKLGRFAQSLSVACEQPLDQFYADVATASRHLYSAHQAALWSFSQERGLAYLLGVSPSAQLGESCRVVEVAGSPFEAVVGSLQPLVVNSEEVRGEPWRTFIDEFKAPNLGVIAIPSRYNPHQVNFILTLLGRFRKDMLYRSIHGVEALLAQVADIALTDARARAEGRVNLIPTSGDGIETYCNGLSGVVKDILKCDVASIFLEDSSGSLKCRTPELVEWNSGIPDSGKFYIRKHTNATARCWADGVTVFIQSFQPEPPPAGTLDWRSQNRVPYKHGPTAKGRRDELLVPLWSVHGASAHTSPPRAVGVVRCTNKRQRENPHSIDRTFFNDDDAAVLSAMCEDAVPVMDLLAERENLRAYVDTVTHEIMSSISGVKRTTEDLMSLTRRPESTVPSQQSLDVIRAATERLSTDVRSISLAVQDARHAARIISGGFAPYLEEVDLNISVIDDVVRSLRAAMVAMNLDPLSLTVRSDSPAIPAMCDVSCLRMALANILFNAIHYRVRRGEQLLIELTCNSTADGIRIDVRDWGMGVERGYEEIIFHLLARTPVAAKANEFGDGMGLWLARRIARVHGGELYLSQNRDIDKNLPTTFTLSLPKFEHQVGG